MHLTAAILIAVHFLALPSSACPGMVPPVDGPIIQEFEPIGRYEGHWGVDFGAPQGAEVRAADSGVVSFAGVVVGNRTVTVDHGGGIKSSYSYLKSIAVATGDRVARGEMLAYSGVAHGMDAIHFSIRIDGIYVDPSRVFSCSLLDPTVALRLVPASQRPRQTAYPVDREKRHPRRYVRSAAHRAFDRRRDRIPANRP